MHRAPVETLEPRRLFANAYYIAPDGSPSNTGTINSPLASINDVTWRVQPGDTVYLRGGTYFPTQQQSMWCDGAPGGRILFTSYPGERAIIDGRNIRAGWQDAVSISGDYIDFTNISVRKSREIGIVVYNASHVRVMYNKVFGSWGVGVWVGGDAAFGDVLVEGNTVHDNSRKTAVVRPEEGGWGQGITASTGSNVRVNRNYVYSNHGEGIGLWKINGAIADGNWVRDNYSVNVYLDTATNAVVRNNFIFSTGQTEFSRFNRPASGVQIATEVAGLPKSRGNLVANNVVVGAGFGFFYGDYIVGGGLIDSTIANNTFIDSVTAAIHIDASNQHSNSRFVNNAAVQQNGGVMVDAYGGVAGISFSHNGWFGSTPIAAARSAADVLTNPRFSGGQRLNPSSYRLLPDSPLVDAGRTVSPV
ncbi:MAG TPA: right-handed parallel beta-helix repeat-containing protein, partial [Tepidisphaeraceae bacterium]|nr:right-handed parallel beta-helix repeat-containing protein [Tepidisphaeraceae bacterium]